MLNERCWCHDNHVLCSIILLQYTHTYSCTASGAAKGLEYLHEKVQPSVIHRVRSSNLLVVDDQDGKIANQSPDTAARLQSISFGVVPLEFQRR